MEGDAACKEQVGQVCMLNKEQYTLLVPPLLVCDNEGGKGVGDEQECLEGSHVRVGDGCQEQDEQDEGKEGRQEQVAGDASREGHGEAYKELVGEGTDKEQLEGSHVGDREGRQEHDEQAEEQVGQLIINQESLLAPPQLVCDKAGTKEKIKAGEGGDVGGQEQPEGRQEHEVGKEGDKYTAAHGGEGGPGGLLGDEGLTSMKKGSFILKEPTGKLDPPSSKESQRQQWRLMMDKSRLRQEQQDMVEKAKKEASKERKRKKSLAAGSGGREVGGKLADVRRFWQNRDSKAVQAEEVQRKRKFSDMKFDPMTDVGKKLCVKEITVSSVESEIADKFKNKLILNLLIVPAVQQQ